MNSSGFRGGIGNLPILLVTWGDLLAIWGDLVVGVVRDLVVFEAEAFQEEGQGQEQIIFLAILLFRNKSAKQASTVTIRHPCEHIKMLGP